MTKTCCVCLESKPLTEFYVHKRKGGTVPFGSCKKCHTDSVKFYNKTPRGRQVSRLHPKKKSPQAALRCVLRWSKRYPEKGAAHDQVYKALKKGTLVKLPYQYCGSTNGIKGHHKDYSKPLDVVWLCRKCHRDQHPEYFARKF